MPKPSSRTRSKKRYRLQLPGGQSGTHYKREKTGRPKCTRCGREISGIPHLVPSEIRRLPASQRKIERPYGNMLCPTCLRDLLKQAVRSS